VATRGDFRNPGDKVGPGFPAVLSDGQDLPEPAEKPFVPQRRKALALWLTQPDHPLTSRVMVNRIWQWHFGRGIVATANDFGRQGDLPTHPELLDWLATEFIARGWSIKAMHRLMLASATYRQSSALPKAEGGRRKEEKTEGSPALQPSALSLQPSVDRDNKLYSHMNRLRLEGEVIRDS